MGEFLLELFSEEMPAGLQARAAQDLARLAQAALAPLMTAPPRALHGPRRLTLVGDMAAGATAAAREERGPRMGAPEQALAGFLRKHGAERSQLIEQNGFHVLVVPGVAVTAPALIAERLPGVLRGFPWPKSMRWGVEDFTWVRPLRRILCVFDGAVVPWALGAHGLVAGDLTEGHRVLAPAPFGARDFAAYEAGLRERWVMLDAAERVTTIRDGLAALAAAEGLTVVPDEALLAEVAGLVEWPVPLLGRIDEAFMDLPPEVMRATLRANQKLFTLVAPLPQAGEGIPFTTPLPQVGEGGARSPREREGEGPPSRAAPYFGLVANLVAADGGAAIVAGNERVVGARLSDARFFWDQDRKQPLEAFLPKLESVVFHAKLGTQGDRVRRLERLAREIAPMVGADLELAARAARLCKADLATGMVGEFPELQGVMGRYYAQAEGEPPEVAEAIGAHYRPLGPGDAVPRGPVALTVALADKLDQLAALFDVGERPTGSSDPFALRRAALGVCRIVTERGLRVSLAPSIEGAVEASRLEGSSKVLLDEASARKDALQALTGEPIGPAAVEQLLTHYRDVAREVLAFVFDRLRVQLRAEGARHDILAAVFGATPDDDIVRLLARTEALRELLEGPDGPNLLAAAKRAANILRIEDKRDGPHAPATDAALLRAPEEQALAAALDTAIPTAERLAQAEDFAGAMRALAELRAPLDAFFDRVTVNDPDLELRRNRLGLLARVKQAMDAVADLSRVEG